ncbi:MAG: sialidase family protein [Bryobacteraceae bacterium]
MNRRDILKTGLLFAGQALAAPERITIYRSGADGYHTYRIPAILRTPKGTLLAFAEARKNTPSDSGDIDMVVKRSSDGGKTWSPQILVADQAEDTIGNPCPVIDRKSHTIWMPLTANPGKANKKDVIEGRGTRTVWITSSKDDGKSWTPTREITSQVKQKDWTWFATGPGIGIQLKDGRLVIPSNHRKVGSDISYSHAMVSTDGGKSWTSGQAVSEKTNECQVVELAGGDLLMNMRSFHGKNRRVVARSKDRGATWTDAHLHEELIEPACQASIIAAGSGSGRVLLFSNPAATKRVNMTVRLSRDEGKTWPAAQSLYAGPSAYSSLVDLGGNQAGCLFECGEKNAYQEICFTKFSLDWIAAGKS